MMVLALLLLAAEPAAAPKTCAARATDLSDSLSSLIASVAGLSDEGKRIFLETARDRQRRLWCETKSATDLTRERLLSVLASDKVDAEALGRARKAEVDARTREEAGELDDLLATMARLPENDRRKLAAYLLKDLRDGWAKRERNRTAEPAQ